MFVRSHKLQIILHQIIHELEIKIEIIFWFRNETGTTIF